MRLLHLTGAYPEYLKNFYANRPGLAKKPYDEQLASLHYDAFAWSDSWTHALGQLGYEGCELVYNAEHLQSAWWKENRQGALPDLYQVAIEQAKAFSPDVLWFDVHDEPLLLALKGALPRLRLSLGWAGSAIPRSDIFKHFDLTLSCAQESVDLLRARGARSEQLHHAFDPRILERLRPFRSDSSDVVFVGQILPGAQYHDQRARLLREIANVSRLSIHSSLAQEPPLLRAKHGIFELSNYLRSPIRGHFPLRSILQRERLRPFLRKAVYGLEMYEILGNAHLVLNIHADSSPRHASNMRLFESTGVGACMLTDWRANLPSLLQPETEVLTYRSPEECIEKIIWCSKNREAARTIGKAAQKRTLRDHSFSKRAELLAHYIKQRIC